MDSLCTKIFSHFNKISSCFTKRSDNEKSSDLKKQKKILDDVLKNHYDEETCNMMSNINNKIIWLYNSSKDKIPSNDSFEEILLKIKNIKKL